MKPLENNYKRMMDVIEETFATRKDPDQIQVTAAQQKKLALIHPATLSEIANEAGPLIWVLVIPTLSVIMQEFLEGKISEKMLLDKTPIGGSYDCIYLCSVSTLPELRGKGETKKLCIKAIKAISAEHPIKTLFVWPFTKAGASLAETVANSCNLALLKINS
jgi:hypothetical protein